MHLQDHIKAVLRGHGIQKTPKAFFYTTELAELYLLPFTGMLLSNLLGLVAERNGIQEFSLRRELLFLCRKIRQYDPGWYCRVFSEGFNVFAYIKSVALEALEHSRAS